MHATYPEMTAHGLRLANYGTIYVAWECSDYSGLGAERRELGAALTEEQAWSISKDRRAEHAMYGRMIQHVDEVACPKSIRTLADKGARFDPIDGGRVWIGKECVAARHDVDKFRGLGHKSCRQLTAAESRYIEAACTIGQDNC